MDVIAANTTGKATPQTGVRHLSFWTEMKLKAISTCSPARVIKRVRGLRACVLIDLTCPGSIPSKYYTTEDRTSVQEFLQACDVLVCSLPATPKTCYLLDRHSLGEVIPVHVTCFADLVKRSCLNAPFSSISVEDPSSSPASTLLWSERYLRKSR